MRALIVDDEKNIRRTLLLALESMGHEAMAAASGPLAIEELKASSYDVVLLDLKLSEESGLDVLQEILRVSPRTAVVMVTAYASVETAVEAMRRGAFDYLPKPCIPDQVRQVLAHIERTRKLVRVVSELESRLIDFGPEADLSTQCAGMRKAVDVAFKAADSDATVLLLGESGTGRGRACPGHAPTKPPKHRRLCYGELSEPVARTVGERLVWPRQRGIHGRARGHKRKGCRG